MNRSEQNKKVKILIFVMLVFFIGMSILMILNSKLLEETQTIEELEEVEDKFTDEFYKQYTPANLDEIIASNEVTPELKSVILKNKILNHEIMSVSVNNDNVSKLESAIRAVIYNKAVVFIGDGEKGKNGFVGIDADSNVVRIAVDSLQEMVNELYGENPNIDIVTTVRESNLFKVSADGKYIYAFYDFVLSNVDNYVKYELINVSKGNDSYKMLLREYNVMNLNNNEKFKLDTYILSNDSEISSNKEYKEIMNNVTTKMVLVEINELKDGKYVKYQIKDKNEVRCVEDINDFNTIAIVHLDKETNKVYAVLNENILLNSGEMINKGRKIEITGNTLWLEELDGKSAYLLGKLIFDEAGIILEI